MLASTVLPAWLNRAIEVWKADCACATVASAVTCSRLEETVTFFMPAPERYDETACALAAVAAKREVNSAGVRNLP